MWHRRRSQAVGLGEWTWFHRGYITADKLTNGNTIQESAYATLPQGASEVSFKVKIDAEDEAYESNEGDNWSRIETFQVFDPAWLVPIINLILN